MVYISYAGGFKVTKREIEKRVLALMHVDTNRLVEDVCRLAKEIEQDNACDDSDYENIWAIVNGY